MFRDAPDLVNARQAGVSCPSRSGSSSRINPEQFKDDLRPVQRTPRAVDADRRPEEAAGQGLRQSSARVQNLALIIAIVQGVAALLLVANTIQVAAYSKRREVAVMKLVGASNWFIQAPFVLEAVVAGLIGSILAYGALVAREDLHLRRLAGGARRRCSPRSRGATSTSCSRCWPASVAWSAPSPAGSRSASTCGSSRRTGSSRALPRRNKRRGRVLVVRVA